MQQIKVIIPAFNEQESVSHVINDLPKIVDEIIVIDNNSNDNTAEVARLAGATVLSEYRKGYGYACLKGIDYLKNLKETPDIVVFLDGDYSDFPEELISLVTPIRDGKFDFVLGARVAEKRESGSMTPQQVFGNWLACFLMKILYGSSFTDLGPFRAIRWNTLIDLNMTDKTYGWTIEMQLKILRKKISYQEVEVNYRQRIGVSKVSGTLKGTIFAGIKIIWWIFKHNFFK
ncbi:MAG: UDP-glucose--dolichyl-phosphate glucosyltransferase [Flavobacteriales bacterium]|nr:UDP-glucose--dolichyl-phosphate glucosyltransferase [Candidatus Arcticimaribacter sp.]